MTIRFLCPNGHGLSSPAEKAGGYGKCPTCNVLFQVPFAETVGEGLRQADAIIGFSCPAGHSIRVPVRMAGQLGKCPTCERSIRVPGAKSVTHARQAGGAAPDFEELQQEEELITHSSESDDAVEEGIMLDPDEVSISEGDSQSMSASKKSGHAPPADSGHRSEHGTAPVGHYPHVPIGSGPPPLDAPGSPGAVSHSLDSQSLPGGVFPNTVAQSVDSPHPMTALFEALWDGTQRDAIVDVYYGDNERISPQHYAHELSHGQHAVFAVLEQNETHTLFLIPWSRIHRVAVREITELPPGMFD